MANQRNNETNCTALRRFASIAALLLTAVTPASLFAGELSGTVTLVSEYLYRGQSLSGGNPALQAGIDYEFDNGIFSGAWASTVDLENFGGRRDAELDFYLGYHHALGETADLSLTVMRYTYPGQSTYFDYDYTEFIGAATLFEHYSVEFGFSDDIYGWGADGSHWELRGDWPLKNAWVVSAGIGYNRLEDQGTSNYWYGDVGASARFGHVMLDVRWYDNEEPAGTLAYLSAGSQLVVSLSTGF